MVSERQKGIIQLALLYALSNRDDLKETFIDWGGDYENINFPTENEIRETLQEFQVL